MQKYAFLFLVMLGAALITYGCNQADEQGTENGGQSEELITTAEAFIQLLAEGQYDEAAQFFDDTMQEELPPSQLEDLWGTLREQAGEYKDLAYDSTEQADGYRIVVLNGSFASADVVFRVTFDDEAQIAGFFIH